MGEFVYGNKIYRATIENRIHGGGWGESNS
jgi:hypothetical protein